MSEIRRRTTGTESESETDRKVNSEDTGKGVHTHLSESVPETKSGEETKPIQSDKETAPEQFDDKTNAENTINETKVLENATKNEPVEKAKEETMIISEEEEQEQDCLLPEDQTKEKDEDLDAELHPDSTAAASLPAGTDKTAEVLDTALKDLHPRWRNWIIRGIFTWVMILSFGFVIYLGPLALVALVLLIQFKCFHEIITIGYVVYKSHELPWFRTLSWYFLITSNYFFYGESMAQYFGVLVSRTELVKPFMTYHRFIAFSLYLSGFIAFVFSLVKKHYLKQFTLFGWTHVTLVIIVTQSHLLIQNIFEGLIWCLVPVTMIICNDIGAYMFGFFFGRTPLIKLSPKKTWEGFVGGAFATVIYGLIVSYFLVQFDFFVCPIRYNETKDVLSMECERSPEFTLTAYSLPIFIQKLGAMVAQDWKYMTVYPFILHSISMSLFASVLGPFGGFFASGFKRAFKIKDFADTIPGHGGFMDRFDCQLLMATFVHVYHSSFITAVGVQKLVQQILSLKTEEQLEILEKLSASLTKRGVLASLKA